MATMVHQRARDDLFTRAQLKDWLVAEGLTGTKADLYTLALRGLLLSVDENPAAAETPNLEDMFLHSSRFVLVDRQGRLRGYFNGDGTINIFDLSLIANNYNQTGETP